MKIDLVNYISSVLKLSKNNKIKSIRKNIDIFYNEIYKQLNPYLRTKNDEKFEIDYILSIQGLGMYLIPSREICYYNKHEPYDIFKSNSSNVLNELTWKELQKLYKRWKRVIRKMKYIRKILNKYKYIMKQIPTNNIWYSNSFNCNINNTSISLCPNFDPIKLFHFIFKTYTNIETTKLDLKEKNIKERKFDKELKSNFFSLNINFLEKNRNNKEYSYSIYFSKNKPNKLVTFYQQEEKLSWTEEEKEIVQKHFNWINSVFETDYKPNFFDLNEYFENLNKISVL